MGAGSKAVYVALPDKTLIPRMPSSLSHAQEVVTNPNSTAVEIAAALKQDPLVAAELLRLADLQVRSIGGRVNTVEHAVVLVGRSATADLLTAAAIKVMPIRTKAFSSNFFWREAILVGKIAERLGQDLIPETPGDHIYLAGALCNIGKLVAAMLEPDALDKVFLAAIDPVAGTTWNEAESRCFGTSHIAFGEIAASLWGLPDFVTEAIVAHHHLPNRAVQTSKVGTVVALAVHLSHALTGNSRRQSDSMGASIERDLSYAPAKMAALVDSLRRDVYEPLRQEHLL